MSRDFKITRNEGEWYNAEVIDSNGNTYQSYFEHAHECSKWIYYIWENEDKFNNVSQSELLDNAIANCVRLDEEREVEPSLD